jgi:excisionase family DNA binding protein
VAFGLPFGGESGGVEIVKTLPAGRVDAADVERLRDVIGSLPDQSPLREVLVHALDLAEGGGGVVVGAFREWMTPSAAAAMLGMSRTHLYKLLDMGVIEAVNVGRDRRIRLADVLVYDRQRLADRKTLIEQFAHADTERADLLEELAAANPISPARP